jgi:hypothetical protein
MPSQQLIEHEKQMLEKLQPHDNTPQVDVSWASAFFQKGATWAIVGKPASD